MEIVMAKKLDAPQLSKEKSEIEKLYKVKILKHVGAYIPDQIIEVTKEFADHLCHVNHIDNGCGEVTAHVRAMLLEDYEEAVLEAKKIENLTVGEASELGIVNTIDSSL